MKDPIAVMCHNIAKYDRDHNTPEMTAAEAAERAAYSSNRLEEMQLNTPCDDDVIALQIGIDALQKIASGELAEVVHAKSTFVNNGKVERWCSCCNHIIPKYAKWCPFCGALMDGDGDSHV